MTKNHRLRIHDYLNHILESTRRIFQYLEEGNELQFLTNTLLQDAIVRNIEVIGEAANKLRKNYPDFVKENPGIPWDDIYKMRNFVAHEYFAVDFKIIWKTLEEDLPILYHKIQHIQSSLKTARSTGE